MINYEAGWKQRWPTASSNTQFNVYYETFDDYQANFAESAIGLNNPTNQQRRDGEQQVRGIEFSGQARFGGFSLDFGVA